MAVASTPPARRRSRPVGQRRPGQVVGRPAGRAGRPRGRGTTSVAAEHVLGSRASSVSGAWRAVGEADLDGVADGVAVVESALSARIMAIWCVVEGVEARRRRRRKSATPSARARGSVKPMSSSLPSSRGGRSPGRRRRSTSGRRRPGRPSTGRCRTPRHDPAGGCSTRSPAKDLVDLLLDRLGQRGAEHREQAHHADADQERRRGGRRCAGGCGWRCAAARSPLTPAQPQGRTASTAPAGRGHQRAEEHDAGQRAPAAPRPARPCRPRRSCRSARGRRRPPRVSTPGPDDAPGPDGSPPSMATSRSAASGATSRPDRRGRARRPR